MATLNHFFVRVWNSSLVVCVFLSLLTALSGCGGGPTYEGAKRVAVSGSVTLDGSPLETGVIAFVPDDSSLRTVSARISDGRYNIPEGQGPNEGNHLVVISGGKREETIEDEENEPDESTETEDGAEPEGKTGLARFVSDTNVVAQEFNLETKLTADTSTGSSFDFEVKSKSE